MIPHIGAVSYMPSSLFPAGFYTINDDWMQTGAWGLSGDLTNNPAELARPRRGATTSKKRRRRWRSHSIRLGAKDERSYSGGARFIHLTVSIR